MPSSAQLSWVKQMIWLRKNWKLASTLACLGSATVALTGREALARVVGVPVHFASHQLCSATFVAGLDSAQFYNEAIRPKLGPIGALLRYDIDRQRREVRTSLAGLVHSRAVYDGPFGCRVLHPGRETRFFQGEADDPPVSPPPPTSLGIVAPANARLSEALDHLLNPSPGRDVSPKPL
jgi:hypothetical protein